ncbi:MAG TPA: GNAT family N-acetyltransferase [Cryptosporangiaceae bacterium]|nr:GNAT family N-acetyltransferase [Cryptosporangiaceae bacterium]
MPPVSLHDRDEIAGLFAADPALHVYELGDLDDLPWPHTVWFADADRQAVALLYVGNPLPILVGIVRPDRAEALRALITELLPSLPRRFYAHLTGGVPEALGSAYLAEDHGVHRKMALTYPAAMAGVDTSEVQLLGPQDLDDLRALYAVSYPGGWFDPRMLDVGPYVGIRRGALLCTVAGVHTFAPAWGVAALGNIATHPDYRGQDLATTAVAALCQRLLATVEHIGLNVHADNVPALACYRRLGFTPVLDYSEFTFTARP